MNIKLTPELKIALELRHSKVPMSVRIKAVLLHAKDYCHGPGLVHENTISRHIKEFIIEHKLTPAWRFV